MSLEPVHFSRLKLMARSPAHYAAASFQQTMAMERGSAVHSILLGGQPVMQWEEGRPRRGREYDAFAADNPGALILTAKEYDKVKAVADSVKSSRLAMAALEGQHELGVTWRIGDRDCAGRMDAVTADGVTELKVSMTADPNRFVFHALRQGWLSQGAWYLDGLAAAGMAREHVRIVAVEPLPPFAVTVFRLDPPTVEQARRTYRTWWEQLMVCEASDFYPSYAQSEVILSVPENNVELDFGETEAA